MPEKLMICLKGISHRGKSGTLKALAEMLIPDPANEKGLYVPNFSRLVKRYKLPNDISEWSKKITDWHPECDICAMVKVNGKRIGIVSDGDDPEIREQLKGLVEQNCAIIFCASRTKLTTVKIVKKMAKGYTLIWTGPYIDNKEPGDKPTDFQNSLNKKKAKHLTDFI